MYIYINKINNTVFSVTKEKKSLTKNDNKYIQEITNTQYQEYKNLIYKRKATEVIKFKDGFYLENSIFNELEQKRNLRNSLLLESDKYMLKDNFENLSKEDQDYLIEYRQSLRDITKTDESDDVSEDIIIDDSIVYL